MIPRFWLRFFHLTIWICLWRMNTLVTSQYQPRLSGITKIVCRWISQSDCSIQIKLNYLALNTNHSTHLIVLYYTIYNYWASSGSPVLSFVCFLLAWFRTVDECLPTIIIVCDVCHRWQSWCQRVCLWSMYIKFHLV